MGYNTYFTGKFNFSGGALSDSLYDKLIDIITMLNGEVVWEGEDGISDTGKIIVKDNIVKCFKGRVVYDQQVYPPH